jgi:hypothetical protein
MIVAILASRDAQFFTGIERQGEETVLQIVLPAVPPDHRLHISDGDIQIDIQSVLIPGKMQIDPRSIQRVGYPETFIVKDMTAI